MFLSKLDLNIRDPKVRRDLGDMYEMHRTLWKAFPGEDQGGAGRVLFRVDNDGTGPLALVQSVFEPNWRTLPVGYLRCPPESKPFDPAFAVGDRLRFRLRANPTKRLREASPIADDAAPDPNRIRILPRGEGRTKSVGRRIGLLSENDQISWLINKAAKAGFTVPGKWVDTEDPESKAPIKLPNFRVDAIPEGRLKHIKEQGSTHVVVRFEGVLIVQDPVLFKQTLFAGVGSGKGFGFGLLSVAKA